MIAGLSEWHERHEDAARALAPVRSLPDHVLLEAYAVMTRLPGGRALPGRVLADALEQRFDEPSLRLDPRNRRRLLHAFAGGGVLGGASYDGLVGLEAQAHGRTLRTLDQRASETYRRLGVPFELI